MTVSESSDYEFVSIADMKSGDQIMYGDWKSETLISNGYIVISNSGTRIRAKQNDGISNYEFDWRYVDLHPNEWYKKVLVTPYDPAQSGDDDDCI